jgi:glycosyltransferase involved in cell wall biosynthesis
MSMSLPCITSPLANHALGAPENTTILVGYTAKEIADHVIDLIEHPEKSERLARNGHQFVLDNFSWETHNKKLENIILYGKP